MAFIDDIKPLLPVFLRLIAIWTEIVVFALALLTFMSLIVFPSTGVLLIFDITVTIIRYKAKKASRQLSQTYLFAPKIWVICLDFFAAALFLGYWIVHTWTIGESFRGWMADSYVLTGELVIAYVSA